MDTETIYSHVSDRYSAAAHASNEAGDVIARAFGYSENDLASIPHGASLGLSCGNPVAVAGLQQGETVVDLGCGAGVDVFLAADKVGPAGKAIGVDMNRDMLAKANKLLGDTSKANMQFVESRITNIALESSTADCLISNCVLNLVPPADKQAAFNEMFRLLKPGGRLALSDMLAKKPFPEEMRRNMALYVGCVAGASLVSEYEQFLRNAGFEDVLITGAGGDLNAYSADDGDSCCRGHPGTDFAGDLNEWAGSFNIYAVKPRRIEATEG
ncbi:Methyltransferase type 11 [Metarhizium rileyi]|uniref:Arsenite methyltransferase n=1 Tax=Metarhizium rileyi (strain RCEF 4871) TaxID=1649241 RepID=A0A166ZXX8_METRR|nr:Methyltransferase type 11 [Metarhizium rileyi RCEF 4871]